MNTDNYDKLREQMIKELADFCALSDGCKRCPINNVLYNCIERDWVDMTDQQLTAAMQAAGLSIEADEADEKARNDKIKQAFDYCDELGRRDIPCEDCIIQYLCMPRMNVRKPFGDFSDDELDEAVELIQQDEAVNRKLEEHTAAKPDMVNKANGMAREEKIQALAYFCCDWDRPCEACPVHGLYAGKGIQCKLWSECTDEELDEALEATNALDMVNKPNHYQLPGGLECWDVMVALFGAEEVKIWAKINAFTYLFRHKKKNGEEDIRKALVNLQKYFELGGEKE